MPEVTIQEGFPRFMRLRAKNRNAPAGADFVAGLVELCNMAIAPDAVAVEVGSWSGESAEILCQYAARLYCVDPWRNGDGAEHEFIFDQRMAAYDNVTKIKTTSAVAASRFAPQSLDFVYIDGLHDYEHVSQDLLLWLPKLRNGGWLAGHDYDDHPLHADVVRAVNDIIIAPAFCFQDSSWAIQIGGIA